ncbi:hypothetical protein J2848_005244 [Azospirillum lipoferum]|uniref:Uncharacterized protein n=2 Tax=Azospirillaceae TaxID=2829815 RepID=A0A5A9GFJ9_AZOLI|nr:hypothetical protein [Azospirillum lipoferum]KAA0593143.1 hypothetical protein FZ942_24710 [Azospirillum lipoferum]MCP1613548.1 hypothetical protein [Azospirillum lipoferum]MDW5532312.1 hypothetical protein [Azospirillum sp. NL1]
MGVEAVAVEADHGNGRAAGGIGGEAPAPRRLGERLIEAAERAFGGEQGREEREDHHPRHRKFHESSVDCSECR